MRVAKLWSEFEGPRRQDKSALAYQRPLKGAFHFIVLRGRRWCRSNGYSRWRSGNGSRDQCWFRCRRTLLQVTQTPFQLRDVSLLGHQFALEFVHRLGIRRRGKQRSRTSHRKAGGQTAHWVTTKPMPSLQMA
jgi:hypothetical protein